MNKTVVKSNIQLNERAYLLEVDNKPDFKAGQVISLWIDNPEQARLYSIASGEHEQNLKILYEVVPEGVLTNRLKVLKPGDSVHISEPLGLFMNSEKEAVWIATGTGIAPFISMVKTGGYENKTLLHGSRTIDGFFFQETLHEMMGSRYKRFCTTEQGDGIIFGRITEYLKHQDNTDTNILYYLCGNNQMVIDVRQILIGNGVPYENIKAEIYF